MKKEPKEEFIRFRVTAKQKRKVLRRAKQVTTYGTITEYMNYLIDEDMN